MTLIEQVHHIFSLPAESAQDRLDAGDRFFENLKAMKRAGVAYKRTKLVADRLFELEVKASTPIARDRAKARYEKAVEEQLRRKAAWLMTCEKCALDVATENGVDVLGDCDETLEGDLAASLELAGE